MSAGVSIYHLVPEAELRSGLTGAAYSPSSLTTDGFVHCSATPASVLAVANDYFADLEGLLLVLRIEPAKLNARLVFEAPAPMPGAATSHLATAEQFPHVYGPVEVRAISGVGVLERCGGEYKWPLEFTPLTL